MSNLYDRFYDPSDKLKKEPRYFYYELAMELINKAKISCDNWYREENTIKGILLLLFCWNFATKETKKLNFENIKEILLECEEELKELEKYTIEDIADEDKELKEKIKKIYDKFKTLMGQTGASKALSLLNPKLFVMWDTRIRKYLKNFYPQYFSGIDNGEKSENYLQFLFWN